MKLGDSKHTTKTIDKLIVHCGNERASIRNSIKLKIESRYKIIKKHYKNYRNHYNIQQCEVDSGNKI